MYIEALQLRTSCKTGICSKYGILLNKAYVKIDMFLLCEISNILKSLSCAVM